MSQILVTADWHIKGDNKIWYRRNNLYGDVAFGLQEVLRVVEENDISSLFLLGDVFDSRLPSAPALWLLHKTMADLHEKLDCDVYYVQGQHEKSKPPIQSSLDPASQHADSLEFELNGVKFYGLDYYSPDIVEEKLRKSPKADVLLTHQVWKDFMGDSRGDARFEWSNTGTILTGDYHQTVVDKFGKKAVVSPGPVAIQSISEPPDKYVILMDESLDVTKVRLKSRGVYEVKISSEDELQEFLDTWNDNDARIPQQGVPRHIAKNILIVRYDAYISDAYRHISARVLDDVHLFMVPDYKSMQQELLDKDPVRSVVNKYGLEGCIREYYKEPEDSCALALELLDEHVDIVTTCENRLRQFLGDEPCR